MMITYRELSAAGQLIVKLRAAAEAAHRQDDAAFWEQASQKITGHLLMAADRADGVYQAYQPQPGRS